MTTPTTTTAPSARAVSHAPVGGSARPAPAAVVAHYLRCDLRRTLRMRETLLFIVLLPSVLYLMYGLQNTVERAGHGNVAAYVMISMAVYGAATATTSLAGATAREHSSGWGRQLGLTALTPSAYFGVKATVGVLMAMLPIALIFATGAATGAVLDSPGRWAAAFVLTLLVALPFSLYGLAAMLLLRTDTATSVASGLLVVMAFFGNLFMHLSDTLLDIARFTPMYGAATLARWPLTEGYAEATTTPESLGVAVVNLVAWTAIFAAACTLLARRSTRR